MRTRSGQLNDCVANLCQYVTHCGETRFINNRQLCMRYSELFAINKRKIVCIRFT